MGRVVPEMTSRRTSWFDCTRYSTTESGRPLGYAVVVGIGVDLHLLPIDGAGGERRAEVLRDRLGGELELLGELRRNLRRQRRAGVPAPGVGDEQEDHDAENADDEQLEQREAAPRPSARNSLGSQDVSRAAHGIGVS